ncbi:MAG TPA: PQQ-dependent sugar dehydrogenase [Marinobacter sp.]|nr:PQQ-dependent sugar dehydrogenase [Marinobacter sp.]
MRFWNLLCSYSKGAESDIAIALSAISLGDLAMVVVMGQGGLLDVAVPPDYKHGDAETGWIYFTYVTPVQREKESGLGATALGRVKLNELLSALQDWQTLLVTKSASDGGRHFGSRIAFIGDYVFFGVGDRGNRSNGQDLTTHAGTIMRLHRDGRLPVSVAEESRPSSKGIYSVYCARQSDCG